MIFDFKENREEAIANGILDEDFGGTRRILFNAEDTLVKGHTFRNFPQLKFGEDYKIVDCTFENCGDVTIEDGEVKNCIFRNIRLLDFIRTNAENCSFCDIDCEFDEEGAVMLEDCEITGSAFENAVLKNGSYLCQGWGTAWVENCSFKNIKTDREDGEIFFCEESTGKIFKRKKQFMIYDESSCTGLGEIEII